jgi:hypothetical protein
MTCTTNISEIPPSAWGGVDNPVLTGPAIIQVYDIDNSDWRAFRKDSVISWTRTGDHLQYLLDGVK